MGVILQCKSYKKAVYFFTVNVLASLNCSNSKEGVSWRLKFFSGSFKIVCLCRKKIQQPLQYISLGRPLSICSAAENEKLWSLISVCVFISDNATMLHIYLYMCVYIHLSIIKQMLGKYKTFQSHKGN